MVSFLCFVQIIFGTAGDHILLMLQIFAEHIKKIQHLWANTVSRRQLKITLSNGTVIRADACHESWEQYGGTTDELRITQDIVERNNAWLHGNGAAVTYDDDGQPTYISEEF